MEQQRQRSAVKMDLRLQFGRNYFYKPPMGDGAEISYNLQQTRKQPELLGQYTHDKQIHIEYDEQKTTTTENWSHAKQILHEALEHVYPVIAKNRQTQIWERKGYGHVAKEEGETFIALITERNKRQHGIAKHDKTLRNMGKHIKLSKTLNEWKAIAQFIKKGNLLLSRKPVIYIGMKHNARKSQKHEYRDHMELNSEPDKHPHIVSFGTYKIHVRTICMKRQYMQYMQKTLQRSSRVGESAKYIT